MSTLDMLSAEIDEISVRALEAGGEPLLDQILRLLGPAIRHSDRMAKGIYRPTPQILKEMRQSIRRAEQTLQAREQELPL